MSLNQQKVQPAERVFEDFEPPTEWVHDESSDTLILMLPGFKKEQLKVQIASTRVLRLSGERQISDNKWRQFRKEFPVPNESDTSGVSAKFENGMLYIKLPKYITPIKTQPPIIQQAPKNPQQPSTPNANNQQKPMDKASFEPKTEKTTNPPPPTPIAPRQEPKVDEESQKKQKPVEKTAEPYKAEKTKAAAPTTPVAPLKEPKKEVDDSVKKTQKEKGKSEASTSRVEGVSEVNNVTKRSQTLELLSRQSQEYMNAVSGLVEEVKKQKKLVNLIMLIFLVLVFGFYVKNAIKSSFGGPKIEEL
ncbi:PREDICTED: inactive protein RESTRICTED TEV MOVEMENT 2-like isoform X2 [Lupinus angustifolius]|uniref:inactive protein RESTRICTED TEV MOVEMENT 2-like isoform X2 n=1 Tax=Lupinus angustifolius TaxID=3871 RepID=UPI00092F9140|nr:PREDICTED: inactive protein RESTRICTED TEV MOVEMENT 2-like isoform X2 [Lupinus angustifolius]